MIKVIKADITELSLDAIVSAANSQLGMGTGVAGAIKRKGGRSIEEEAISKGPIPVGEAVATGAGLLQARFVIHAAAMGQDLATDTAKVRSATRNALLRAEEHHIKSIAFPALGTGVGGLRLDEAAKAMVSEIRRHLARGSGLEEVVFALFNEEGLDAFTPIARREKIVCLGDSITYGFPYGPEESWVEMCSRGLGVKMINKGVNGDTTHGMWLRFNPDVSSLRPAYVVIMGGTNDAFLGYTLEEVQESVEDMVAEAFENGICPAIGLPVPINIGTYVPDDVGVANSLLESYRDWMKEYAGKELLPVLDFYSPFLDAQTGQVHSGYFLDEAHPAKIGYMVLGKVAERALHNLKKCL